MKRIITLLICSIMVLGIGGCSSNENSRSSYRTNGELQELLAEKNWKGYCSNDECYLLKNEDENTKITKIDSYDLIKEDLEISDDEITGYLDWMETRKETGHLSDDEILNTIVDDNTFENNNDAESEDFMTVGQENAYYTALDYLDYTSFSKQGLIEQLEYEGYTTEEAEFAVEKCNVDWGKQAELKAKDYMEYDSFSRQGLLDQLLYEGFTQEEAEQGVKAVGY